LDESAARLEAVLDELTGAAPLAQETHRPPRLVAAVRHALLGGGKRLRPFLVIECARLFDEGVNASLAAAAVECLHTYSLVHDDLPAMDDDALRRGRPTVHIAFDEATAVLAGDALLTLAFDVLAREETHPEPTVRADLVLTLARAAGMGGMAGGQMLDLLAEGEALDEPAIRRLQAMKTGALFAACCEMGAVLGRAGRDGRAAMRSFGAALGRAFQIADDLLDLESDASALGKAAGKDAAAGKATLVALLGPAGARALLAEVVGECERALLPFGERADALREAARFVASRRA